MIAKPINSIIKKHFQELFKTANEKARKDFAVNIEAKLQDLDHFNKFKFIVEEYEKNSALAEQCDHPYYIKNHSSEEWLLNQFASRAFLLNVDESKQLADAIYLGEYKGLIFDVELKLREEIPAYTYADLMDGKIDPYLANLEKHYNITEEEYYKIRGWQAENLIKIVSYESRMLIKQIQKHCKSLDDPLQFIHSEKEKIETKLKTAEPDARQIKSDLAELFIFNKQKMEIFNDELLIENFNWYKSDLIDWKYIFPSYINPLLEKVNQGADKIISNESTVFLTISKLSEWFEAVIKGRSIQQPVIETDWNKRFNALKKDATAQAESLQKELYKYVENPDLSKKEIKKYLIDQLEIYRYKFNAFERKELFSLLREEKEEVLKQAFVSTSFFGNALDEQTKNITEAIIISSVAWEIAYLYQDIFETHKVDYPENDASHIDIMFLMHQMVLDKELYEGLEKSMDDFIKHFHSFGMPLEIHFQNNRVSMKQVFHKSLDRLQTHLEDAEPSNKVLYLQSRLKDLKQREIQMKKFEHVERFSKKEFRYPKLFKEFLQIEADFISETKDLHILPALPQGNGKPLALNESAETFDKLLTETNAAFILKMLEDLGITTNGKANVSQRKKGSIRGVVIAAKDNGILPSRSIPSLCKLIASEIGLDLKKVGPSDESREYERKARAYIKSNYTS